jgi:hypothetical protein
MLRPGCGRRPIQKTGSKKIAIEKARDRFPGAGSIVATMTIVPVICPTCQIFSRGWRREIQLRNPNRSAGQEFP